MVLPDAARDLRDIRPSQQRIAQSREGHARISGATVGAPRPSDVLAERLLALVVGVRVEDGLHDGVDGGLRLQRCEARRCWHLKRGPARSDERQTARPVRELHVELRAEPVDHAARSTGGGHHALFRPYECSRGQFRWGNPRARLRTAAAHSDSWQNAPLRPWLDDKKLWPWRVLRVQKSAQR